MKDYRRECILGPLFKLTEATFELFIPLIVAVIIDHGIGESNLTYIIQMSLVLLGLGVLGLISSVTAQYFAAKAACGFTARIRHALMERISGMSYADLDRAGETALITRMTSDTNQVQTGVNLTLRLLLRSPFVVFGAMIMAFTVDIPSALIFAVTIPALGIVIAAVMFTTVPIYRRVQSKLESVLGKTRENLTGARVIRAFCREEDEIKDFDARNSALTKIQKFAGGISGLLNPVTFVMVNIAVILIIRTGAFRVNTGELTQGEVVALYNYTAQILVELIKMASLIINLTKSIASGNRIQAVLDEYDSEPINNIPNITEASPSTDAGSDSGYAVEFRGVSLRYPGASANSLESVDIAVRRGETVGVIGGTGSGKTTLINLIPRFYDATCGEVLVNGMNVRSYAPEKLRSKIGTVPQKASLFRGSIGENLRLGREDASDSELLDAARLAQAFDIIEKKGGLDSVIEEGGRNLSGGQRQRLTVARALVRKPKILILDDSSSALDYATDAALRRSLHSLDWKPAVFIVSQRTSSVRHADKIIVLDDGHVAGIGTDRELFDNCPVYREICESQRERRAE